MTSSGGIPAEALLDLRRRLDELPSRHPDRRTLIESTAGLFGVSRSTVYRALSGQLRPMGLRRADRGEPRKIPRIELERYCEIIAALKIRTSNLKGRRLSTTRAIELIEKYGIETPNGLIRAPKDLLNKATVNRYLRLWGYDHARMTRAPAAVRGADVKRALAVRYQSFGPEGNRAASMDRPEPQGRPHAHAVQRRR